MASKYLTTLSSKLKAKMKSNLGAQTTKSISEELENSPHTKMMEKFGYTKTTPKLKNISCSTEIKNTEAVSMSGSSKRSMKRKCSNELLLYDNGEENIKLLHSDISESVLSTKNSAINSSIENRKLNESKISSAIDNENYCDRHTKCSIPNGNMKCINVSDSQSDIDLDEIKGEQKKQSPNERVESISKETKIQSSCVKRNKNKPPQTSFKMEKITSLHQTGMSPGEMNLGEHKSILCGNPIGKKFKFNVTEEVQEYARDLADRFSDETKKSPTLYEIKFLSSNALEMLLRYNDKAICKGQTKEEMVKMVHEYMKFGVPPRCPKCKRVSLRFSNGKKRYGKRYFWCPGSTTDGTHFYGCNFKAQKDEIERILWKCP